jgi:hypothetical protein
MRPLAWPNSRDPSCPHWEANLDVETGQRQREADSVGLHGLQLRHHRRAIHGLVPPIPVSRVLMWDCSRASGRTR